ncbi:pro-resilin-like [Euwallacea similis]|uniref:pro-resilin-like n=1 Tax=Euwallacea similis TaxID=1736056 RepID=UPI00344F3086
MQKKIALFLLGLIGVVRSQSSVYGPPGQAYGPPAGDYPSGHGVGGHGGYEEPQSYEFGYRVKDDYSGSNFLQKEESDGNQVKGEYRVALPDGRTQIVTYWADWKTGFHADVKYEGEATYPQAKPQYGPPSNGNGFGGYQGGYNYPSPDINTGHHID